MRTYNQIVKRCEAYTGYDLIYHDWGYIVWQIGTGDNVEILFIEVTEERKGYGRSLIKEMLKKVHPYNSVYVFRRAINEKAGFFYRALGFEETTIRDLYNGEDAVLGVIAYKDL